MRGDFTLGADPELGFRTVGGDFILAHNVLDDINYACKFGLDGSSSIAEIRPDPSEDPYQVVRNIQKAMRGKLARNKKLATLHWVAGSAIDGRGIGGHIHFGVGADESAYASVYAYWLDKYLAPFGLLLEDPSQSRSRRYNSYGQLHDTRYQDWGFEYRTLGSWLTSPYVALGFLCLAKVVVWETRKRMDETPSPYAASNWVFNGLSETYSLWQQKFHARDVSFFRKKLPSLWKEISHFELYSKYKNEIGLLRTLINARRSWFPKCSLREAWGLPTPKTGDK